MAPLIFSTLEVTIMSCNVCHKPLDGRIQCPRCQFMNSAVFGNADDVRPMMEEDVRSYRQRYLSRFRFGITMRNWKEQGSTYAEKSAEELLFGNGSELYGKTVFLPRDFARLPGDGTLSIEAFILEDSQKRPVTFRIGQLPQPMLQKIGLRLDSLDNKLMLILSLDNGQERQDSVPVALFPD